MEVSNSLASTPVDPFQQSSAIQDIVLQYLVQHGYTATAKQFVNQVGKESGQLQKLFDLVEERKTVYYEICTGKIENVLYLIQTYFCKLLEDTTVQYKLIVLQYLEVLLVQQQKEAALEFFQTKIRSLFSCQTIPIPDSILDECKTLLLFQCYHKEVLQQNWDSIPSYAAIMQPYCKPQYKQNVAEWINNKICCLYNHSLPQTPLERILQQSLVVRQQMEKDHIWYEHIAPLLKYKSHPHHDSQLSTQQVSQQASQLPGEMQHSSNKPTEEVKDLMEDEATTSSVTSPVGTVTSTAMLGGENFVDEDDSSDESSISDGEDEEEESDGEDEVRAMDEKSKRFIRDMKSEFRFVDQLFLQSLQQ